MKKLHANAFLSYGESFSHIIEVILYHLDEDNFVNNYIKQNNVVLKLLKISFKSPEIERIMCYNVDLIVKFDNNWRIKRIPYHSIDVKFDNSWRMKRIICLHLYQIKRSYIIVLTLVWSLIIAEEWKGSYFTT